MVNRAQYATLGLLNILKSPLRSFITHLNLKNCSLPPSRAKKKLRSVCQNNRFINRLLMYVFLTPVIAPLAILPFRFFRVAFPFLHFHTHTHTLSSYFIVVRLSLGGTPGPEALLFGRQFSASDLPVVFCQIEEV